MDSGCQIFGHLPACRHVCLSLCVACRERLTPLLLSHPHPFISSCLHLHYDKHASELRLASLSLCCPPHCSVTAGQPRTTEPDTRCGYRHGDYNDHHRGQKPHLKMCAHANEHVEIVRTHTQTCGGGWTSVLSPCSPDQRRTDGWRRDRASFRERNKQAGLGIITPPRVSLLTF